jgi:dolichol-phosphate mannosyltransferase
MRALLTIPTYNESENLESLIQKIVQATPDLDILIIDDSSPDGTGDIADRLAAKNIQLKVMHRPPKSGRGTASLDGYKYALKNAYDYYLEMDCDHSHNPAELPRMLAEAGNADMIIGSRFLEGGHVAGWNTYRKTLHFAADCTIKIILGLSITDPTNGYHCYSTKMLARVDFDKLNFKGYAAHTILKALLNMAGYKIKEVPSFFENRKKGNSKMSLKEARSGMRDMLSFRYRCLTRGYRYFLIPQSGR